MKKKFLCMLAIAIMSIGIVQAQKVLLPFGQFTQEPWVATFFYAPKSGDKPADDWYITNFDDSNWDTIEGPVSTTSGLSYYATQWNGKYSTYWVRRHFTAENIANYSFANLYIRHDDGCDIYLNGTLIYSSTNYYSTLVTVPMTEDKLSLIADGDNVLAIKVSDTRGGQSFMDVGITVYNAQPLTNFDFNDNLNGWTCTGSGIQRGGQSFNYVVRCLSASPFDVSQTVVGRKGLYRLRTQAFEEYGGGDAALAYRIYQNNKQANSYIYAGDYHYMVKDIFDEAVADNIYSSVNSGWFKTPDATYVPKSLTAVSIAFRDSMYENEMFAYIDTTTFNVGIAKSESTEMSVWTVFDNFRLEYFGENDLDTFIDSMYTLAALPMETSKRNVLITLAANLKAAPGYEAKGRLLSARTTEYSSARYSSEQYALVIDAADALQCRLDTGSMMTASTITEAKKLLQQTRHQIAEGTLPTNMAKSVVFQLKELEQRLGYTYIDIAINIPGSLGDSILNHVENFIDVQSLKLSGTLAEADFKIIQNRLTQLRELDLSDVNMTTLPVKAFSQRKMLEIVKLPNNLTLIDEYAFYQCSGIKKIDFPVSLTAISHYAFSECDNLQEVILPEGLTTLGESSFYSCDNNRYVKIPSTLKVIEPYTFSNNICLTEVDFAEGLTSINNDAFYGCSALKSLHFPSTLYHIGADAFSNCSSITSIDFNEGLYQIENNAFYDCDSLVEVTLPSSLVLANASPFDYCDNLIKVTCLSIEPPYITEQIPYGVSMDGRELYVPAIAINAYKQSTWWDKFSVIKPIDSLPVNINIIGDTRLNIPYNLPATYKPRVNIIHDLINHSYQYGHLTVTGQSMLSLSNFSMIWDSNVAYEYYTWDSYNHTYATMINHSQIRSDHVEITTFIRNNKWNFVSFPFDIKVSDITATEPGITSWVIRRYDGKKRANGETGSTWVKLDANDIMEAGKGYILQGNRYNGYSIDYSGLRMKAINNGNKNNIFLADDASVSLNEYQSEFTHNRSWNLIGNPYPCYYDTRFMDYRAPITVWDMYYETYKAYNPVDDDYILSPGESFFVQCPIGVKEIIFRKEGRLATSTIRDAYPSRSSDFTNSRPPGNTRTIVNLTIGSSEGFTDRTRVVLNNAASLQYEMDKDASKFISTDTTRPQIYTTTNGVDYAINERPLGDGIVNIVVQTASNGSYTIALTHDIEGYQIMLEDTHLGLSTPLSEDTSYSFDANTGTDRSRFILHFTTETSDITEQTAVTLNPLPIYTLEGVRVSAPSHKGIYIQGGKKVIMNQ